MARNLDSRKVIASVSNNELLIYDDQQTGSQEAKAKDTETQETEATEGQEVDDSKIRKISLGKLQTGRIARLKDDIIIALSGKEIYEIDVSQDEPTPVLRVEADVGVKISLTQLGSITPTPDGKFVICNFVKESKLGYIIYQVTDGDTWTEVDRRQTSSPDKSGIKHTARKLSSSYQVIGVQCWDDNHHGDLIELDLEGKITICQEKEDVTASNVWDWLVDEDNYIWSCELKGIVRHSNL